MYQRVFKYLSALTIPIFASISFLGNGWWAYTLPILTFIYIPFAELFTESNSENFSVEQEKKALDDPFYDRLLYIMVPLQYIMIFLGLYLVKNPESFTLNFDIVSSAVQPLAGIDYISGLGWNAKLPFTSEPLYFVGDLSLVNWNVAWTNFELGGKLFAMIICCGVVGINLGHELGHRLGKFDRFLAKCLLLSSMYMHFIIEHNRGHHMLVATDEDPASSRRGELLYVFWIRSLITGYISAWKIEIETLRKKEISLFSWKNEMLQFAVIQGALLGLIFAIFGFKIMIFFFIAALGGGLLLETVNYIEHYGLRRTKNEKTGKYEQVFPTHSWNSNHKLGRIFLFELTRHSDHHYIASRKFQTLRHFDESPQMPFGYPSMMILAAIPPLWFFIMHRHIETHKTLLASRNRFSAQQAGA